MTARGIERRSIYRDDRDRVHFRDLLEATVERFGVRLHAFVLMNNHYHLLVETPAANLSPAMQWLNVSYSVWFNRRRGRAGHVFQGRFKAIVAEPGADTLELSRYVHLNPVRVKSLGLDKATQARTRAGLGNGAPVPDRVRERVRRLRGYPWSSYRVYAGFEPAPPWLTTGSVLELLGTGKGRQEERYRQFVEQAVREGLAESPWERVEAGLALGGKEFVERLRKLARGNVQQQPELRRLQRRCTIADVVRSIEKLKGTQWKEFRDEHGDWGRDLVLWLGRKVAGAKLRELAALAEVNAEAAIAVAVKRLDKRLQQEPLLRRKMEAAKADLLNVKM